MSSGNDSADVQTNRPGCRPRDRHPRFGPADLGGVDQRGISACRQVSPMWSGTTSNEHTEIHQRSLDGTLQSIVRRTAEPPPVTGRAWRSELEHRARNMEMSSWPRRTEEDEPIPRRQRYPAVESILVDAAGCLWVKEWSSSESGIPDQWSVFSPEGRWLGVLPFPPDPAAPDLDLCARTASTCRVGKDYFLIVREDELGRERVEGYRIRRNDH